MGRSQPLRAPLLALLLAACVTPASPPNAGETGQPLWRDPKKSLWSTEETADGSRVIHYYIDRHSLVSGMSPAQVKCAYPFPDLFGGTHLGDDLSGASVDAIHDAVARYNDTTPIRFVELTTLPGAISLDETTIDLHDPGYDILVFTGWDKHGAAKGDDAPNGST